MPFPHSIRHLICLLLVFFLSPAAVAADPHVPAELEPWRQWVLHDHEHLNCPLGGNGESVAYTCVWPGRFELDVDARGARFEQRIDSGSRTFYALPVAGKHAPLDVRIDGQPAPVIQRNGRAYVELPVATITLTGRFAWDVRPASVTLPPTTGLVALTLDGQRVERPRWDANALFLGQPAATAAPSSENRVDLAVYRVLADGAPPTMRVTLRLDVAGTRREIALGKVLPDAFEPAELYSPLPTRLDSDGLLQVQVSPGQWVIRLVARTSPPLGSATFERQGDYWPQEEVWSYAEAPQLRVTEPDAARPVDPSQVGVPAADRELPAFVLKPGETLSVVERQRGFSRDARNELRLDRTMWLSFERDQYVVRDTLSGTLRRDWRLDVAEPLVLQSVRSNNDNLLVTRSADDGLRGVEIRQPRLNLDAVSNIDAVGGPLPVSGWQTDITNVSLTVNLPPGHRLLAALNVDQSRGDWASRWTLLDFFLVLVFAAVLWRIHAPWLGVVGLLALVLTVHETNAPAWSWLVFAALVGALGVLPAGRLRASVRMAAAAALIGFALIAVPFVAKQLTFALYPQLEASMTAYSAPRPRPVTAPADADSVQEVVVTGSRVENMVLESAAPVSTISREYAQSKSAGRGQALNRYLGDVQVQAGPGLPGWRSSRNSLNWVGPIARDQTFRLIILPAWAVSLWRLLSVALILLVAAMLARRFARTFADTREPPADPPPPESAASTSASIFGALGAMLLLASAHGLATPTASADVPSASILEALEERLTEPPECAPACTSIERARVSADGDSLSIRLVIHAQATAAVALPGDPSGWHPTRISVDGAAVDALALVDDTFQLVLEPGVHRVAISGPLPSATSVTVAFPQNPGDVEFDGSGWDASGLSDRQLTASALTLARISEAPPGEDNTFDAMDVERFPVFVRVHRHLVFDLDWTVTTTVTRVTPPTAAINVAVPLLPDEAVNREDLSVVNGIASVALAPGQRALKWQSTLTRTSPVTLVAAADAPWQETWRVEAGPNWRLQHDGVPPDNRDPANYATWQIDFTPWPGETLGLDVTRPTPVEGPTLAIDSAALQKTLGRRGAQSELVLAYRATQGGQHALTLPPGSELTALSQDDVRLARGLDGDTLTLPIVPGSHTLKINWRSNNGSTLTARGEAVDLGLDAANVSTTLRLTGDRWVLWTSGPVQGPAVLYWSELLALILAAVALGRLTRTPLGVTSWLLLGLGFSTFFWPSLTVLVITLLAFRWREKTTLTGTGVFNATQVALALLFGLSAMALLTTIPFGLLGSPDMHVTGNGSYGNALTWFADRVSGVLPDVAVLSVPMWVYKGLILLWSLWLAMAVLRWLPWMWRAWTRDGHWRSSPGRSSAAPAPVSNRETPP